MMRNINDAFNTLINPNKANILAACKELGITSFQVEYQGCGDSGGVSEISCEPKEHLTLLETHHCEQLRPKYCAENKDVISQQVATPLKEAMDDLTCDLLNYYSPGWEINEGSEGTLYFDIETGEGEIQHTVFSSEYEQYDLSA